MNLLRDIVKILLSGHTLGQKKNYIKYLISRKGNVLGYDPVTISIVGTTRCTLNCDMCPTHSGKVSGDYPYKQKNIRDIDFEMFREMIDRFKNATTVHIIGSGEPLLNEDFFRMVDYAHQRKMIVKTFSNGTTIKKNMDNILNSKLDGITISLNGHDSKEFARMTGAEEKVYDEIYAATKALVDEKKKRGSGVKVKLSFIIDRVNYRDIPKMVDIGLGLSVDHIFFCNFLASPYSGLKADERALFAEGGLTDELNAIFGKYPPEVRKKLTPPVLIDKTMSWNNCRSHFSQIRFDGDGNVSSCSMMLLNMCGNGNYRDPDVWNNVFFRNMRAKFLSGSMEALPEPCLVCPDNKGVKIL